MGVITEKHQIFYNALSSFDKLVNLLYNSNQQEKSKIDADLLISTAREAPKGKAHIAFTHTKEDLRYSYGRNLRYVSEQSGVALHQGFHKVWLR